MSGRALHHAWLACGLAACAVGQDSATDADEAGSTDALSFVSLPGGSFQMGQDSSALPGASTEDTPPHTVHLSAFDISDTEVTNQAYLDFLNEAWEAGYLEVTEVTERWPDGSSQTHDWVFAEGQPLVQLSTSGGVASSGHPEHPDNRSWIGWDGDSFTLVDEDKATWPVTWVKWYGADAFARWYGLALPTEAQWEYAARCVSPGTDHTAEFATASGEAVDGEANWNGDAPGVDNDQDAVVAVRTLPPSPCGLYEMSGNAWEWVADWYEDGAFYEASAGATDPIQDQGSDPATAQGAATYVPGTVSTFRVRRGGSWNYHTATLTSWSRAYDFPQRGNNHFGFRVVR